MTTVAEINQQALQNIQEKKEVALPAKTPEIKDISNDEKLNTISTPEVMQISQQEQVNQAEAEEQPQVINTDIRQQALDTLIKEQKPQEQEVVQEDLTTQPNDPTPFSDILPLVKAVATQKNIEEWAAKVPNEDLTQPIQTNQGIVYVDAPAQSISGLRNGTNLGYSRTDTLRGECGREAQRWTTLPNGKNWTIGSTIQEKKNQLAGHVKNGDAFYQGNDVPTVGNSVVFNGGKWGHVAVIAEIKDGKARLEEANLNNDHRFTNTRWVSLADPSILGFLKTVKRGS